MASVKIDVQRFHEDHILTTWVLKTPNDDVKSVFHEQHGKFSISSAFRSSDLFLCETTPSG
jgi:hypothetical protein